MDNKKISIVVATIVMLSAFAGASMQSAFAFSPAADGTIKIVSLHTDKDIYHLNENMEIILSVHSAENVNNVLINVSGLKGRHEKNLVSLSRDANLSAGENKVFFSYKIPSCGCAVSYGNHFINASVVYNNGEVVSAAHSIVLTSRNKITYVNITVEEAKRIVDTKECTLLDVRIEEEYNSAHIRGAKLIPVAELSNRTEELNMSKKIVVYSGSGHNSSIATDILIENGFERVYNVVRGIDAWEESGYPVVNTTSTPEQPGFEVVLAIAALLVVACLVKRNKREGC